MKKLLSLAMVVFLATSSVSASYNHDKNCTKECCKKEAKCCKENCKDEKCAEHGKKCETKPACCTKQKPA